MMTDITLENDIRKIIIDAKFYRETMKFHFNKERINSGNLYQLFSYLLNQEDESDKNRKARGVLLYPTVKQEYDLEYRYKDHPIHIRTVNLNMNWRDIAKRLHDIIA
jgi:5-methylcytosine-specific restriction enzyme subunit McrC